jgi:hypothetical protein
MKILKGSLTETRYAWPTVDLNNSEDHHMQVISEKLYQADQVTYMSDKLGLHRISNPDKENYAVSLHCESTILHCGFGTDDDLQCILHPTQQYTAATSSTKPMATPHTWPDARSSPSMVHLLRARYAFKETSAVGASTEAWSGED